MIVANLVLTTSCNRRCPYCFAAEAMASGARRQMSLCEVVHFADLLVAAGQRRIGLLGGEPTLHPEFITIVTYLLARGLRVRVFTNALCSDEVQNRLERIKDSGLLSFVVNVNAPEDNPPNTMDRQIAFLQRFAPSADLSLNIYRPDLDPEFMVEVIERAGLGKRRIRVGIAQPMAGQQNAFLRLGDYRQVSEGIVRLAEVVLRWGMCVSFDCGFLLCAFTNDQLGRLARCRAETRFICDPAIDLAPQMNAWSCFPLATATRTAVSKCTRPDDLMQGFRQQNEQFRAGRKGVLAECDTCIYLQQGICHGGCLAYLVPSVPANGADAVFCEAATADE